MLYKSPSLLQKNSGERLATARRYAAEQSKDSRLTAAANHRSIKQRMHRRPTSMRWAKGLADTLLTNVPALTEAARKAELPTAQSRLKTPKLESGANTEPHDAETKPANPKRPKSMPRKIHRRTTTGPSNTGMSRIGHRVTARISGVPSRPSKRWFRTLKLRRRFSTQTSKRLSKPRSGRVASNRCLIWTMKLF